ncbi:MAG: hypothetical protein LBT05_11885 [Planctomycetaceae bacterium]|jgi:sulfur transfer protein SufE|nr:hypothetical protein [Planctomycetaceae bacterium]
MQRVKQAGDKEIRQLEEAVDDVVYLTNQGETPTDALFKVASLAQFSDGLIRIVAASYNNGMSSEITCKRRIAIVVSKCFAT